MATALELLRADVLNHAKSLSEITTVLMAVKKSVDELAKDDAVDEAVQKVQEASLEKRLAQIEQSIAKVRTDFDEKFDRLYKLGWWLLATFGASIIIGFANFMIKGGLTVTTISTPS